MLPLPGEAGVKACCLILKPWNNVTGVQQYLTESFTNFYQTTDQATNGQNLVTFACTALGLYEDNLV